MDLPHAQNALQFPANVAEAQEAEIAEYPPDMMQQSDSEEDIPDNSILDAFYEASGTAGIIRMTNLTYDEMFTLFMSCHEQITEEWKGSKRNPKKCSLLDVFFMMLVALKSGLTWFFLGSQFRMNSATVERLVVRMIKCISKHCYNIHIIK